MNTNRKILTACIASMLLIGTVSAQTIYKQVDEEGRIIFTDQPALGSRILGTIETARPRTPPPVVENNDSAGLTDSNARPSEPERRGFTEQQREGSRRIVSETAVIPGAPVIRKPVDVPGAAGGPNAQQAGLAVTRGGAGDVERAVATYTALNTPMAAQADAAEAARRARQAGTKDSVGPVLVVQATPREHDQVIKKSGMDSMYYIWATTFFVMAAGLLYVGWQVFRLILGTAFPRWHVGAA